MIYSTTSISQINSVPPESIEALLCEETDLWCFIHPRYLTIINLFQQVLPHNHDSKDVDENVESKLVYNRNSPFIFIGGFPRSGTTLMRAMLDAHPDIRCGQETRVIPGVLQFKSSYYSDREKERTAEAGVSEDILDAAMSAFILEVIVHHGDPAPRLCTKDPFILSSAQYMAKLFRNAKFLFMVRDGRASVYSTVLRNVSISDFNTTNIRDCLETWNDVVATMYDECQALGSERCKMIHYEQLVLHPRHWMEEILSYLQVPWDEAVLHHEEKINKQGGVRISRLEKSSDQVIKPVNIEALTRWVGFYPKDVERDMGHIAPMLLKLGYDITSNTPNYGAPDDFVLENTRLIQNKVDYWREKAKQLIFRIHTNSLWS